MLRPGLLLLNYPAHGKVIAVRLAVLLCSGKPSNSARLLRSQRILGANIYAFGWVQSFPHNSRISDSDKSLNISVQSTALCVITRHRFCGLFQWALSGLITWFYDTAGSHHNHLVLKTVMPSLSLEKYGKEYCDTHEACSMSYL
jgi:hypothetical protein